MKAVSNNLVAQLNRLISYQDKDWGLLDKLQWLNETKIHIQHGVNFPEQDALSNLHKGLIKTFLCQQVTTSNCLRRLMYKELNKSAHLCQTPPKLDFYPICSSQSIDQIIEELKTQVLTMKGFFKFIKPCNKERRKDILIWLPESKSYFLPFL